MSSSAALSTAVGAVKAPLLYKGKVRELYDLGEHMLIVVTDRISAFDYVLKPAIPDKGRVLNQLSKFWFEKTSDIIPNHMVHTSLGRLGDVVLDKEQLRDRLMVVKKAKRLDVECVVRGYITGGGWRQYQKNGQVNGIPLPPSLRKNQKLERPLFTPALKNDEGHDEDVPVEEVEKRLGAELTRKLIDKSMALYEFGRDYCERHGIVLADTKFEFGLLDGELILIDEIFTPDSSRFWAKENYMLDVDIDSMDKEPVRTYLASSDWDKNSEPDPLPDRVVEATSRRYRQIMQRLLAKDAVIHRDQQLLGGSRKMMKATVYVTIKQSVLDPQGNAVQGALHSMGFREVEQVRIGKYMEIKLDTTDRDEAVRRVKEMCEKLLANTVIEDYRYELEGI